MATQGFTLRRIGHFAEAAQSLQEAYALARKIPDYSLIISASADLGRCYLREGHLEQALNELEISQRSFMPFLGGDSYTSLRNGYAEAYLLAVERTADDPNARTDLMKQACIACQEALKQGRAFRPSLP